MLTANQIVEQCRRTALSPEVARKLGNPRANVDERSVLERVGGMGVSRRGEERERELRGVQEL